MGAIVSITDRRREKRWDFERKMLRRIDIQKMEKAIERWIRPVMPFHFQGYPFLIDQCMEMTIDAFLLGTEYGKFGYHGEPFKESKRRCESDLLYLSHDLAATLSGWHEKETKETTVIATDVLINDWWDKGYHESHKAHKLRLV